MVWDKVTLTVILPLCFYQYARLHSEQKSVISYMFQLSHRRLLYNTPGFLSLLVLAMESKHICQLYSYYIPQLNRVEDLIAVFMIVMLTFANIHCGQPR